MSGREKLTDWIKVYDGAFSDEVCDKLVAWFENPNTGKGQHQETWRRCFEAANIDFSEHWETVKNTMRDYYQRYRNDIASGTLSRANFLEAPNIFRYDVSELPNVFNTHADNWNAATALRQVSIILYMNDVETGGETHFDDLALDVPPKKGRLLFFPSFYTYMHQGKAPISNSKYIMVSWIHYDNNTHSYRVHQI